MADPHGSRPVLAGGAPLATAKRVMILLHGRGATADDILGLGLAIAPEGWALLAPQAAGNAWYPLSFLAPRQQNEPFLSSALQKVGLLLESAIRARVPANRVVLAGFSQGACLATEFVGRHPLRYGALLAFTGGLIGPSEVPLTLQGDLAGTPILLSSGDPDPHVPWSRVVESAGLLQGIGGRVDLHRHAGRPHTVTAAEVQLARTMIEAV